MATDSRPGQRQYHLGMGPEDVGGYVLLPGDPARTDLIAKYFDQPRLIGQNREFRTWTGKLGNVPVSATSTGIGGPSTAIAVSELLNLGAHTFIRVGSCGSLQDSIRAEELIIATGAVRDEGTTKQYVPIEYPAIAHHEIVSALQFAARAASYPATSGIVYCKDALTAAYPLPTNPLYDQLMQRTRAWVKARVLVSEMESAAIFVLATLAGARAGSILRVIGVGESMPASGLDPAIQVAIGAVQALIERDHTTTRFEARD